MDPVLLARWKFALTAGFHFLFPPLTIGLAWVLCWLLWKHYRTGAEVYGRLGRFWLRLFAISFVIGVVTGITLEFQFGTNWSQYSRFVGDIFGAPLAAEGIFSFFLESTFVGVLIFGWGRVSRKTTWFASLMVAVGATLSAFWIIVANSWMQTPAGFKIANGRAELVDFWAAAFNPSTLPRYLHTVDAALITGGMFVTGIGAYMMLKGRQIEMARRSVKAGLCVTLAAALLQFGLGHYHAVQVAHTQPEKLAAFEGLFETQKQAPALLFGIPDEKTGTVSHAVRIPGLLSLMAFGDADAEVKGLNDFPRSNWPPLAMTFYPFHLMVLLGGWFVVLPAMGLVLFRRRLQGGSRWLLWVMVLSIPLPFIANELGWIAAEVGRQPWIVYGVMRTADAASPVAVVPAGQILAAIILLSLVYLALLGVWFHLIRRTIAKELESPEPGPIQAAVSETTSPRISE
ncbi:MAG: Cytochrome bd-I ubiquinol oxidase subunit 1 [Planctomycetes bacterium ADurb.Bin126]|nr:MAG: Cytochrome bd-I ubiquinol oxidase subunit 1 [Planctomycetes bacterium ADurb.Bin126]HOD82570.1 cytochrome ubiquinol oxidase subunit I [Phycisphaerae bacterium]HQL74164.1 cytochrome ubiquinol oxidase subunit I [Phycisphaerae bacterium]